MRGHEKRKRIKTLFLLGAGASYSLTKQYASNKTKQAPLDQEFTERLLSMKDRCHWIEKTKDRIKNDWKDHHSFKDLGLETAVIKQIGHFDFLNSIHRKKGTSGRHITDYIYDLTHLITVLLNKVQANDTQNVKEFCSLAFPQNIPFEKQKNRIITFNYDTVVDNHLSDRFKPTELYFDRIKTEATKDKIRRTKKKDFPLLIKLHGSINWRVSKDEYIKVIADNNNAEDKSRTHTYDTMGCHFLEKIWRSENNPEPDDDDAPLIIPPLPQKPITNVAIFRYLWTYAYEYLHECNELAICGYSLPETDTLAVSLFSNFKNDTLKRIKIIDPNVAVIKKWKDLLSRKGISNQIVWTYYDDFAQYIKMEKERFEQYALNRAKKKTKSTIA